MSDVEHISVSERFASPSAIVSFAGDVLFADEAANELIGTVTAWSKIWSDAELASWALSQAVSGNGVSFRSSTVNKPSMELEAILFPKVGEKTFTMVLVSIGERKESALLQKRLDLFREMIRVSELHLGLMTLDGILVEASDTPLDLSQLKREQVVGTHLFETNWFRDQPESHDPLRDMMAQARAGARATKQFKVPIADHREINIELTFTPMLSKTTQRPEFIVLSSTIIDDLIIFQEHLRRSRDLIHGIFEASPDPIAVRRIGGGYELLNGAAQDLHALIQQDSASGRPATSHDLEDSEQFKRGISIHRDQIVQDANSGEERTFSTTITPLLDDHGEVVRILEISKDLTDYLRTNRALMASEERMRLATETLGIGLHSWNSDGGRYLWSDQNCRNHGIVPGTFGGSEEEFLSLISEQDRPTFAAALKEWTSNSSGQFDRRYRIQSGDREKFLRFIAVKIDEKQGDAISTVGITLDITDDVLADLQSAEREAEMAELRSELEHIERLNAMSEIAAALAHELNQPLAAIANYSTTMRMMARTARNGDDEDLLKKISGQAIRAGEIIRRLRDFTSANILDWQPISIEKLIMDASFLALPVSGSRTEILNIQIEEPGATVLVDPIQIQQVVVNLVRNAVEACEDEQDPQVILRVGSLTERGYCFAVHDNGPGIPKDRLEAIFQPFHSTKESGMGIGLSICSRILGLYGSELEVRRDEDETVFSFYLPAADE